MKCKFIFVLVYNRGGGAEVSGGCTGIFIFFFIVRVVSVRLIYRVVSVQCWRDILH